jgi:hypothetical protein
MEDPSFQKVDQNGCEVVAKSPRARQNERESVEAPLEYKLSPDSGLNAQPIYRHTWRNSVVQDYCFFVRIINGPA